MPVARVFTYDVTVNFKFGKIRHTEKAHNEAEAIEKTKKRVRHAYLAESITAEPREKA